MSTGFCRSVLYVPADKPRAIEKARTLACDAIIMDLEDAIAPEAKVEARQNALRAIRDGGFGERQVVLRVNALDSAWGRDDLTASAGLDVSAILVPKVASAQMLRACRACLGATPPLWAMIETCASILHLSVLTAECKEVGLTGLVVGTNDLSKEMRCRVDGPRTALLPALTMAVLAARAHGLLIIDGVYGDLKDANGLRRECAQGVQLGFDGKSLIHPDQIDIANEAFSPAEEEIIAARAIVAAFEDPAQAGRGVITMNGKMLERLHLEQARRVLALAEKMRAP